MIAQFSKRHSSDTIKSDEEQVRRRMYDINNLSSEFELTIHVNRTKAALWSTYPRSRVEYASRRVRAAGAHDQELSRQVGREGCGCSDERAGKRVRIAGVEMRSWRKDEEPPGMSQGFRAEKANVGSKVIEKNLGALTNDTFPFCSGQRASLYSPGIVQPYDRILARKRNYEGDLQ